VDRDKRRVYVRVRACDCARVRSPAAAGTRFPPNSLPMQLWMFVGRLTRAVPRPYFGRENRSLEHSLPRFVSLPCPEETSFAQPPRIRESANPRIKRSSTPPHPIEPRDPEETDVRRCICIVQRNVTVRNARERDEARSSLFRAILAELGQSLKTLMYPRYPLRVRVRDRSKRTVSNATRPTFEQQPVNRTCTLDDS